MSKEHGGQDSGTDREVVDNMCISVDTAFNCDVHDDDGKEENTQGSRHKWWLFSFKILFVYQKLVKSGIQFTKSLRARNWNLVEITFV